MRRYLQLDDLRKLNSPQGIALVFQSLGYNAEVQPINLEALDLSKGNIDALKEAYLIADQNNAGLQVLLFHLEETEWASTSMVSTRMKAIASQVCQRATKFLLMATKDYSQLMLVNPRVHLEDEKRLKSSIKKLVIDLNSPTAYDREVLDSIAVDGKNAKELYEAQCESFDVEKLTKKFYNKYKELFDKVQQTVKKYNQHPYFDDLNLLHQFSQRLLGRIMFLYFLQKKEFLTGDKKFLTKCYGNRDLEKTDYYKEVLEILFFDTLNNQRENNNSQWGKIPYFNGGLFDRDYGLGIRDPTGRATPDAIFLPNSLFNPDDSEAILGFFNSYNFTVSENTLEDEEIAVDPEMLGKVFENMLAADERGKSGTFYTPRNIVNFICTEVLCRYLADEVEMELEKVQALIDADGDLPNAEFNKLITPQQTKRLKNALESLKVLDPAVGSGAFVLGMMQVILTVRQAIARREGMTVQRGSLKISQWKREIIANNLYGVDIKPEAIEIAKLRMWLSLVVDLSSIENVEPLPNLDYKLMCGNSLISQVHGETLIPNPREIQQLLKLQYRYFDTHTEKRQELRELILEVETNIFRVALRYGRQYWQEKLEANKTKQNQQKNISDRLTELDKFAAEIESGKRSFALFDYYIHFRDVFTKKGGFDVVIANPPYIQQQKIKKVKPLLEPEYECYDGLGDLYMYFYERSFKLLKPKGLLGCISSNQWLKIQSGEKLRKYFAKSSQIYNIIDLGKLNIFEAVVASTMIFIARKNKVEKQVISFTQVNSLEKLYSNMSALVKKEGIILPSHAIKEGNWTLTNTLTVNLINKIKSKFINLEEYINGIIYRGILTGFNEAFFIDSQTKEKLIDEDISSAEIIQPLVEGKDVKKWHIRNNDKWLITSKKGINIDKYPAIFKHLKKWEPQLKNRRDKGKYWWELRSCNYYDLFDKPKIIFPENCKEPRFTLDLNHFFPNNKAYIIPLNDLFLLGILNSSLAWLYAQLVCGTLKKTVKLQSVKFKTLPIPTAAITDRLEIEALVQKCLDAKGKDVEEWEAEIDDRVAHLYGLTDAEIKIVRDK